ncbi:hypothetical protein KEM56_002495 [Ascosphaera pollenicola]|nr:hypothetical protein KEM56_002495 [Ascosphaera pollenicola]
MSSTYPMYVMPSSRPAGSLMTHSAKYHPREIREAPADVETPDGRSKRRQASGQKQPSTNVVFTDPIAFSFLEEDSATTVVSRRAILSGYQVYIVEKWACSRIHPTFVINTYTGDPSHHVIVNVLSLPTDEKAWSHRLKIYFNAVSHFYARRTETPLGMLMVTSLSSFPSDLTVIPAPSGDISKHRLHFIVNEDLKRLGCSGRSGFTLSHPSPATEAKFYQLYKASERVSLYDAVIELVKQCQMALSIFDMLPSEYVDGLLCDLTEKAFNEWWTVIATDLYNAEPNDGTLGPTTVAALLGTLMGARNRLHAYGAPVPKDVFDIPSMKRGIGSFQKSQKLEKTRRLDRQTLDRLHRCTAKAASGDAGWAVPRAVKSTVVELGGKGGEMVMGMVGGKDKAGISEVETLDIDRFVQLVHGERSKWLWQGKPRKTADVHHSGKDEPMVFTQDSQGGYIWTSWRKEKELTQSYASRKSLEVNPLTRQVSEGSAAGASIEEKDRDRERELESKGERVGSGLKKSVSTKVSDAKAGLGRFRDAVNIPGLRSHHHKRSKETVYDDEDMLAYRPGLSFEMNREETGPADSTGDKESPNYGEAASATVQLTETLSDVSPVSSRQEASNRLQQQEPAPAHMEPGSPEKDTTKEQDRSQIPERRSEDGIALANAISPPSIFRNYRRSKSADPVLARRQRSSRRDCNLRCPRHLSFSVAEESVLTWAPVIEEDLATEGTIQNIDAEMARENFLVTQIQRLKSRISHLAHDTAPWVESEIAAVKTLDDEYQTHTTELQHLYQSRLDDFRALQSTVVEISAREGSLLAEEVKKTELMGAKLDYEISVLQSKVADVEAGISDYEAHVEQIENRIRRIIGQENNVRKTWKNWFTSIWATEGTAQS